MDSGQPTPPGAEAGGTPPGLPPDAVLPAAETPPGGTAPGSLGAVGPAPQAFLALMDGPAKGHRFAVRHGMTLGRGSLCDITVPGDQVSRQHAEVTASSGGWKIRDLKSSNGLFVNDARVRTSRLRHNDRITLGDTHIRFLVTQPSEPSAAAEAVILHGGGAIRTFSRLPPDAVSLHEALQTGDLTRVARANARLRALETITAALAPVRPLAQVYPLIVEQLLATVPAERAALLRVDADGTLVPEVVRNRVQVGGSVEVNQRLMDEVMRDRVGLFSRVTTRGRTSTGDTGGGESELRSVLCAPIQADEELLGILYFDVGEHAGAFADEDLHFVVAGAGVAAVALRNAMALDEVRGAAEALNRAYISILAVLANAIEARDHYTVGHTWRVTRFGQVIARRMGWSEEEVTALEVGGLVHDIGKLGVPDAILRKPGPLTEEEYARMKLHPEIGARMLQDVPQLEHVIPYVLHHQERWDGSGYPAGLEGEDIPLEARVLAVADALDAMTSSRPYRRGMDPDVVITEMREQAGQQFDPAVVRAVCDAYEAGDLDPYLQVGERGPGDVICPFCSTYFAPSNSEVQRGRVSCPTCARALRLQATDDRVYAELV